MIYALYVLIGFIIFVIVIKAPVWFDVLIGFITAIYAYILRKNSEKKKRQK